MRKPIFAVAFYVVALVSVIPGVAQSPNCDGTEPVEAKCNNGDVPQGYYESLQCQGNLGEVGPCYHYIAFAHNDFVCSEPMETGDPPAYRTYCVDGSTSAECTRWRACKGVTYYDDMMNPYTVCVNDDDEYSTTRLLKTYLANDLPPPNYCITPPPMP